jgi:wyosine [tRNA(Phe)-imidazoG37] synthetase (radical SAM superfamily)
MRIPPVFDGRPMPERVKRSGCGLHGEASTVFGPVPSRLFGRSLGITNVPPKTSTYSCVYCQRGRTFRYNDAREAFYAPGEIRDAVREKLREAAERGKRLDNISFVPDGGPTLDARPARIFEEVRDFARHYAAR